MAQIDVKTASEQMLDGMSNFILPKQWAELLSDRSSPTLKDTGLILSMKFLDKYKNSIYFDAFPLYLAAAWEIQHITPEFVRKHWRFSDFVGGNDDIILQDKNFYGQPNGLATWFKANCCGINVADIDTGVAPALTMEELDKRPFFYNAALWRISLCYMKELTIEFIHKYIHMMSFNQILNNDNLSAEFKDKVLEEFGMEFTKDDKTYRLFPDGSVIEGKDFRTVTPGRPYYSNKGRFGIEDEAALETIKAIKAKFPRAFEDCEFPENAAVMVDK